VFFSQRGRADSEAEPYQAPSEERMEVDVDSGRVQEGTIEVDGNVHIESLDERVIEMTGTLVIGSGASFKGRIRTEGNAQINGKYEGSIETTGELVLGPTADVRGTLHADGDIRIEGTYVGDVKTDNSVVVGQQAKVLADVSARDVSVAGAVKGDVVANNVEVDRTGRIWGDLTVHSFTLQDGGFVSGRVKMPTDISPEDLFAELESST
jgi:cytoskeletal protein CcmA (bactofilin family)